MYEGSLYFGRRGPAIHAISGVEIALWDIAGKAAGKPIHALLGGARRHGVKAYASTLMPDTPAEARPASSSPARGRLPGGQARLGAARPSAELDVALVAAARKAGGDDFELMIDIGKGWQSARGHRPRAADGGVPACPGSRSRSGPTTTTNTARWPRPSTRRSPAARRRRRLADFERLVEKGNVEIVQPDVTRAGGIRECLRIAEYARRTGRRSCPHSWSTGIIKAASLHVLAVIDEAEYFECCVQTTELNQRLVRERFPVEDGFVAVPTAAGLGVTLDESVVSECLVEH